MITKMTEPCILCGDIKIPTEKQLSIEMISKITELYILCGDIQLPTEKHSLLLKWLQRWKTLTFFVGAFKVQLTEPYIFVGTIQIPVEKAVQYPNDFKDDRTLHRLWGHSNSNWKRQFSTEMISKITELYILWGEIQTPTKKRQFSIEMITKMTETNILCGDISIPNWRRQFSIEIIPKMTETYIPFGDIQIPIDRTLHLLLGYSNSNWKNSSVSKWFQTWQKLTSDSVWRLSNSNWKMQFSIELISKITELYILCGSIRILNEKDSLVLKSFQRWQNLTFFVGTFKFRLTEPHIFCWDIQIQLKKRVQYWNDFKDDGPEHPLRWHSNPTEKDNSISKRFERSQNFTSFVGPFKTQLKKTVHYRNDYKDDRTLHCLWGHSNSDWEKQFSIEMISKITELYILCWDIQVSTEKRQFSIEMISKMTEPCILCGDIQIPTEKSLQHRNDFKDQRTLHSLLGHSNPNWKTQIIIQMITKMTDPDILCWRIQISIERSLHILLGHSNSNWKKTVYYPNDFRDDRTLHSLWGHSNSNWKRQFSI